MANNECKLGSDCNLIEVLEGLIQIRKGPVFDMGYRLGYRI
jgi:hypothetical protein